MASLHSRVATFGSNKVFHFLIELLNGSQRTVILVSSAVNIKFFRSDRENREWEQKLDEKENKIQELRIAKNRLEARIVELEQMLAVERGNAQSMNDALEREVEHRLQTEKQVLVLQQRFHGEPYIFHL